MGISGLLPALKEIQVHGNIADFKGKRLAVDAYVWLHKGAFGCAEELVKGKKTTKFVDYAMYRIRLLRHHGIEPYVVFDGGPLPAKKKTESSREKSRNDNLARAQSLEGQGRLRDARDAYTKCVDITPEMAFQLIKALRAENVDYVVAPYEADAQLCFLERESLVDGIITEDSDLLVFGCQHVIFKLESSGQCVSIKADKLAMVKEFPMHGWTDVQFRRMAMLSGCDYLDSIPGVGLKTAHRLLRRHKTVEKVVQMLRLEGTLNVPPNYIKAFAQAELAFLHQRVFDPMLKRLVPLNGFPVGGLSEDDEKWVGLDMEEETAQGVAKGDLHPETRLSIVDMCPDYQPQPRGDGRKRVVVPTQVAKGKVAGPMDAFISRAKVCKPLPTPVGQLGSGASRLSERDINVLLDPPTATAVKRSKFFGSNRMPKQEEVIELHWETSDEAGPSQSRSRSRSPSPIPSVHSVISPAKARTDHEESLTHLTSPFGPNCSSPALSSPPQADIETQPLTSPRPAHRRSARSRSRSRSMTPASPTRNTRTPIANVLIPSTSQIPIISQTQTQTQAQTPIAIPSTSSPAPTAAVPIGALATSTFSNHPSSSDSIFSDELVTPSLPLEKTQSSQGRPPITKRERDSLGKRSRRDLVGDDEDAYMEEELRAEKAKVIAKDWRLKYAFGGASLQTPVVRPSNKKRSVSDNPTPTIQPKPKSTPLSLSATMPRVLSSRPANIPDTPLPAIAPKHKAPVPVPAPAPSSSPPSDTPTVGSGRSRLDRFRFTGKVDTRQNSSPSL